MNKITVTLVIMAAVMGSCMLTGCDDSSEGNHKSVDVTGSWQEPNLGSLSLQQNGTVVTGRYMTNIGVYPVTNGQMIDGTGISFFVNLPRGTQQWRGNASMDTIIFTVTMCSSSGCEIFDGIRFTRL